MIAPKFITFEGGEGAGKSTQVDRLSNAFKKQNIPLITTREPGGSDGAEAIRGLLVSGKPNRWQPKTELLLHYAARIEHISNLLKPSLDNGKWVISDRFADSTFAYQGFGHGIDLRHLTNIHAFAVEKYKPDCSILLDLTVQEGLSRAKAREIDEDRYEQMGHDFHERVRSGFLEMSAKEPDRFIVIDGSQPVDYVALKVIESINKRFDLNLI
tara:strand:- start:401 stop:1039 length:639 start_codon:yes stop_codon:yes gene_type:complete